VQPIFRLAALALRQENGQQHADGIPKRASVALWKIFAPSESIAGLPPAFLGFA